MQDSKIKLEDKYIPAEDIIKRKVGDDMCIYSPSKSLIMFLNQTAVFIFNTCDGKNSLEQIGLMLSETYKSESLERLNNDLINIISQMIDKGFLHKV
jgi:hypothetical protein